MTPFLHSVAEYIYKNYGNELHSVAVVFPNKRARLFFTKYLSEVASKPVFSPKYYTITEYIQEISAETIADQLSLLFLLYESYISVTQSKESFDDFLFYCEMMLSDFDDIDKYIVDAGMLYRNLSDLKELEAFTDYLDETQLKAIRQFWETFNAGRNSDEKNKFGTIWQQLLKIYIDFKQRLIQNGLAYEGMAYRNAINSIEQNQIELPGAKVAFVGFNALNKCEERLFEIVKKRDRGLFFWDYDDFYLKRKSFHEAAYFLGNLVMKFPSPQGFSFETGLSSADKKIRIIDIPTSIGQAKSLPGIMANLPEGWKEKPLHTAIALADECLLMPVLSSLPTDIGEINVSMGYPLKETQVYGLISVLIDLHQNKKIKSDGRELFYHTDVKRFLQHGLFSSRDMLLTDAFLEEIIKSNEVFIDFEKRPKESIPLSFAFRKGVAAAGFIPYLLTVLDELNNLVKTGDFQLKDTELEAMSRVISQLRRMSDILAESNVEYSFKSLLRLIEKLLQSTTLPFTGEPLSGLQVMGILETRLLDFENLVILSMNEGVFPKPGNVPTFIPYTLRKAFNMPTIEHQDAIFAYYFYRLLQRAKNVVLVYSSSTSDNKSGEPSRFIRQLEYDDTFQKQRQTLTYSVFPHKTTRLVAKKDDFSRNYLRQRYSGETASALSPSAINTYLNCQLRFYLRYIANIPEPESILEEIESNVLGSILHKSMEVLYKPFEGKVVDAKEVETLLSDSAKQKFAIDKAFYEEYFSPGKEFSGDETIEYAGKNLIVREVIAQYIKQIIRFDMKRAPLAITGLEKRFVHKINLTDGSSIQVGGIIDRIENNRGITRIIDYKTGKVKNTFISVEDLFTAEADKRNEAAFQTLLYSMVVSKNNGTMAIQPNLYFVREMNLNTFESELFTGDKKDTKIETVEPFLNDFEQMLQQTLESIFSNSGEFLQTTSEKICQNCPYRDICLI